LPVSVGFAEFELIKPIVGSQLGVHVLFLSTGQFQSDILKRETFETQKLVDVL
jgi:hypothetical protein